MARASSISDACPFTYYIKHESTQDTEDIPLAMYVVEDCFKHEAEGNNIPCSSWKEQNSLINQWFLLSK